MIQIQIGYTTVLQNANCKNDYGHGSVHTRMAQAVAFAPGSIKYKFRHVNSECFKSFFCLTLRPVDSVHLLLHCVKFFSLNKVDQYQ